MKEVKSSIEQLISKHGNRGDLELYKDSFLFEISTLAKLAWRQGVKVEVNSQLIPKEILPIKPLDNYEIPYNF